MNKNEVVLEKSRGFTLMELMIVMALVMILSVVGIGAYTSATVKSKDTQRKSDLNQYVKALESFNNDIGRYPTADANGLPVCVSLDTESQPSTITVMDCFGSLKVQINGENLVYLKFPTDPEPKKDYLYETTDGGVTYALYAALDNMEDRDVVVDGSGNPTTWSGKDCGNVECNYKITETGLQRVNE